MFASLIKIGYDLSTKLKIPLSLCDVKQSHYFIINNLCIYFTNYLALIILFNYTIQLIMKHSDSAKKLQVMDFGKMN